GANLTFEKPDPEVFKCIRLAYDAIKAGGSYTAALNGANEVLVDLFLQKQIRFIDIQRTLEKIMADHKAQYNLGLEDVLEIDSRVRKSVKEYFG
ncbi:MAG: 1-deoxy-D-xylulose-5-phosphate reductoisomerase, partial [Firmicutes bacterium]|nr:1-deoxy-D-xylulose-5-phosphate reductoisomerase [Bacillota bacterium]